MRTVRQQPAFSSLKPNSRSPLRRNALLERNSPLERNALLERRELREWPALRGRYVLCEWPVLSERDMLGRNALRECHTLLERTARAASFCP